MTRTTTTFATLATLAALGLAVLPQAARAAGGGGSTNQSLTLNTGDTITVSGAGIAGHIGATVYTAPNAQTTITAATYYAVQTNGTSTFTLGAGGTLSAGSTSFGLDAEGSGPIMISGGTVTAGYQGTGLRLYGTGPVTVSGGAISGGLYGLQAAGTGPVTITGGTFTGGQFSYGLDADPSGTIDLFGSFTGYDPGTTTDLARGTGSFFGTLQNNTTSQTFTYDNFNRITLHALAAAPEPSQFAAFAIGLLGLSALVLKAKRRTA